MLASASCANSLIGSKIRLSAIVKVLGRQALAFSRMPGAEFALL